MKADADYWKGFWAGRAIAVRLAGLKAPEADWYLYNGVRLPKLPEWDKTVYPYATMFTNWGRFLVVYAKPLPCNSEGFVSSNGEAIDHILFVYLKTEDKADWHVHSSSSGSLGLPDAFWSNYDILNEDGSLYLAASEPIPTT